MTIPTSTLKFPDKLWTWLSSAVEVFPESKIFGRTRPPPIKKETWTRGINRLKIFSMAHRAPKIRAWVNSDISNCKTWCSKRDDPRTNLCTRHSRALQEDSVKGWLAPSRSLSVPVPGIAPITSDLQYSQRQIWEWVEKCSKATVERSNQGKWVNSESHWASFRTDTGTKGPTTATCA